MVTNDDITAKIKSKEMKWISPPIWPDEYAVDKTAPWKIKLND